MKGKSRDGEGSRKDTSSIAIMILQVSRLNAVKKTSQALIKLAATVRVY